MTERAKFENRNKGVALLACLLALLLLTAIALGLMYLGDAETRTNDNFRSSQQAYFAALAGLQNVRERMMLANTAPHQIVPPTSMPGSGSSVVYVLNPAGSSDAVTPATAGSSYYDEQLCQEMAAENISCPLASSNIVTTTENGPPNLNTTAALPYKWVRINRKANASCAPYYNNGSSGTATLLTQVCWNGVSELPVTLLPVMDCTLSAGSDPAGWSPVYELTSLAVTANGASRMMQMEVAQDPPLVTRGAVDSQDHVDLNGSLLINGWDYCTCQCTTTKVDNKNVTTCTNRAGQVCDASHYAIYAAGTVDNPTPSETLIAGTPQPVVQNQPWPWDIDSLVARYRDASGTLNVTRAPYSWNCSSGTCGTRAGQVFGLPPNFPPTPPSNPAGPTGMASQVTYVPGNVQLTGDAVGNGVLVVDGNLDIHGGLNFYGLVVVRGVISFTGGGSSGVNIYGAVLAGQQSYVDTTLGGSANIHFDFCSLPQGSQNQPPRVLSFRELLL
ncbi:MAG TPA: hypothetical protein VLC12_09080 [Terriglobales bacterium]|nr:hypothetical protein [Terriglobales bacterium]